MSYTGTCVAWIGAHALYEAHLLQGFDAAGSAREATLAVRRAHRNRGESTHPFYWAAFVAAGR